MSEKSYSDAGISITDTTQLKCVQLVKEFPAFIEIEGSSPYSQEPSTGLYPYLINIFLTNSSKIHFNITFPTTARSSECSLPFRYPD
jgi:hypothetical protein